MSSNISRQLGKLIDGKAFALSLTEDIKNEVKLFINNGSLVPGLAVVLVGNDPASEVYVKNKATQTHRVGMRSFIHMLPEDTPQEELIDLIIQLNENPRIHGILVQLPLPSHIDPVIIINTISPCKDVDGLGEVNAGRLMLGAEGIVPCTPLGCLKLLRKVHEDLTGKHVVVIGASNLVGKPVSQLLLHEHCTVSIGHIHTRDTRSLARAGDILIVATGKHELVRGDWIKPGATVIDVGITRVPTSNGQTKLVGDVVFEEARQVAEYITPVPGGVGPMTVACLLHNTLQAARKIENPC